MRPPRGLGYEGRFVADGISTASPERLLVMLFDRLVLDLERAEAGIGRNDVQLAHTNLVHAQNILLELRSSLKLDVWDGAAALADLYAFMYSELVKANFSKDHRKVAEVRRLVEPLRDAWAEAATKLAATGTMSLPGMTHATA